MVCKSSVPAEEILEGQGRVLLQCAFCQSVNVVTHAVRMCLTPAPSPAFLCRRRCCRCCPSDLQVSITTEVPAFTLQGAVLRRVSPEALLNLALAATAVRLALYGLLPLAGTPWAVLPIELLHGITFGLGWGAATASSTRLAPPHLAATMQVGPGACLV